FNLYNDVEWYVSSGRQYKASGRLRKTHKKEKCFRPRFPHCQFFCIAKRQRNYHPSSCRRGPKGPSRGRVSTTGGLCLSRREASPLRQHRQESLPPNGEVWRLVTCDDCRKCIVDGGKLLCLDVDVRPVPNSCHALSFGIGYDMSFEKALVQYGCKVTAFDPTSINLTNTVHPGNIQAIRLGLDARDHEFVQNFADLRHQKTEQHQMSYRKYQSVIELLDYPDVDLLKIDIEGSEWKVFSQILSSPKSRNLLKNIRQILLEVHLDFLTAGDDLETTYYNVLQATAVFERLEGLGFHLAAFELNESTLSQYVLHNVNVSLYREISLIRRTTNH
ncbi:uncharacterized protein LOC135226325, partial [Macrobrachium nipponense]|uniref:uncharacterized protein LOC135226325 n=1 Tax=Macrobrachium nipponense TaxID=159736 RepID=UPI0030C80254